MVIVLLNGFNSVRPMKTFVVISFFCSLYTLTAQTDMPQQYWQVGIGFGEIPFLSQSFKPSITVGYRLNQYVYVGAIYQFLDNIQRDDDSFDAQSIGFDGLVSSKERVGQRALLHARITPIQYGPFISVGLVMNDDDTETIQFDARNRKIGNNYYNGDISVSLTRERAIRPAIGLGYEYIVNKNIGVNIEWTFNVFHPVPSPLIETQSPFAISEEDSNIFKQRISKEFTDNFHNRYHIFHIGATYNF